MGSKVQATRRATLGEGWTRLEYAGFFTFTITMLTPDITLRKRISIIGIPGFPVGETTDPNISVEWYEVIPYAQVEAKGRTGQTVEYVYTRL
jgi:hypothetical protein